MKTKLTILCSLWVVIIAGAAGWAMNLIDLVGMADEGITTELVIRIVGVFAVPLGAMMGWL